MNKQDPDLLRRLGPPKSVRDIPTPKTFRCGFCGEIVKTGLVYCIDGDFVHYRCLEDYADRWLCRVDEYGEIKAACDADSARESLEHMRQRGLL